MTYRQNDIAFWSWAPKILEKHQTDPYWCKARKAIFHESTGKFHDIFWLASYNGYEPRDIHTEFKPEDENFVFEYKGNLDEFAKSSMDWPDLRQYYEEDDILSLAHGNEMRGSTYLRKGAKKSFALIKEVLEYKISELESHISYKTRELERKKRELGNLTEENIGEVCV